MKFKFNLLSTNLYLSISVLLCWFIYDLHHLLLNYLFFNKKSVHVPNKLWLFRVDLVFLHTSLKQPYNIAVIGVLVKRKASTVVHELFELIWMTLTKILDLHLFLFLFDVGVFLSL